MPVDPYLEMLAASPLRDHKRINSIFLPDGKLPPKKRTEEEILNSRANAAASRVRAKEDAQRKVEALLDHYATTSIPFDRVAEHTGLDVGKVFVEMRKRGRAA